ncbi:CNP1-like family protein [Thiocystis violacea]|uniref:CNP1-like family protein n=1 Tax=Thiocystis violacea TaxID=13725 RepID=UPI0019060163|nr:CNP1-like family protein [Thiocystis violacea]MBK1719276.1 hypothetical protein [Thiocystis violacea]
MKHALLLSFLSLIVWTATIRAEESPFIHEPEPLTPSSVRPGAPWSEAPTRLPPLPGDADLIEFKLDGPADAFRYFIDGKHLEIGPDRVVRYTLVAESGSGARNITHEGIRCTPKGRYRVFAYETGGRFTQFEGNDWLTIATDGTEGYRLDLWRHHFCVPREFMPRPRKDMIRSLKGHISPRQNTGFQAD